MLWFRPVILFLFAAFVVEAQQADSAVIAAGNLHTFVSNRTQPYGFGPDAQTFRIGRNDFLFPSMEWKSENQPNNHYLYNGTFWIGLNNNTVRFQAKPGTFHIFQNDPTQPSPAVVSFIMNDDSADAGNFVGLEAKCSVYAWPDPSLRDALIYRYTIRNRSQDTLKNVYAGLLMDYDIAASENSNNGSYNYWDDDKVGFSLNADYNGINESISYMYDGENPDGRPSDPSVSGYIGTRILESPPTKSHPAANRQRGHHWISRGFFTRPGSQAYSLLEYDIFDQLTPEPGDYRYMQSLGPWDVSAGDSITLAFGVGIGHGLIAMKQVMETVYQKYWQQFHAPDLPKIVGREPQQNLVQMNVENQAFSVQAEDVNGDVLKYTWLYDGEIIRTGGTEFVFDKAPLEGDHLLAVDVSDGKFTTRTEWLLVVSSPKRFTLGRNFPNPFNGGTNIRFEINTPGNVLIRIYNGLGQQVARVIDEHLEEGKYLAFWNGKDSRSQPVASGVYFLHLQASGNIAVRKIILMR